MIQFNNYKYLELIHKLNPFLLEWEPSDRTLAYEILEDWCWTISRQTLFINWQKLQKKPQLDSDNLTLLHYNIRNFYSNQVELLDMIDKFKPHIISLNELGTEVPLNTIRKTLFSFDIFKSPGTNTHGGVVIAVEKRLRARAIEQHLSNMVTTVLTLNGRTFTVTSIYSPPTEKLPLQALSKLRENSKDFILVGDFNAKHAEWGCPTQNQKGRDLEKWLKSHNMFVHNEGMRTSRRSMTTIDLIITPDNQFSINCQPLHYNGSDHVPIIIECNNITVTDQTFESPKINWTVYKTILTILEEEITDCFQAITNHPAEWFELFENLLVGLKARVTKWHTIKSKRPTISKALRILLKHKHYLANRYRHSRTEEDRLNLRSWQNIIRKEFQHHKAISWNQFISKVASPNPANFWKTVKTLNKKRSVHFTAITDGNSLHTDPDRILSHLTNHFTSRFTSPTINPNNKTDIEATALWNRLSDTDSTDIRSACSHSDLQFTTKELQNVLRTLKSKHSTGLDGISNTMIKLLPGCYAPILTAQYNDLFAEARWKNEWKQARTVCFNKADNPAPTTQQLRPISLLPVLGKVYERLFMLRFQTWLQTRGILPWQQSGARKHQCTTSRVNHLLEQVTNSLRYNTFTPTVFVDFKQAFDMLWQAGLLLKLERLECPTAYLLWITSYFNERSMKLDINGQLSQSIAIQRGAPQGSVFGPIAYITAHHDLQQVFEQPENTHLYVDDLGIVYTPTIYLNYKNQLLDMEKRINHDLAMLLAYANQWHQPVNSQKTHVIFFSSAVKRPKLNLTYNNNIINQVTSFKYLGFTMDSKLTFKSMIDDQLRKCKKAYPILKHIHRHFSSFFKLKLIFFTTYIWPHISMLSTIYCLISLYQQERLNGFYRRCLRIIYCLFQCSTSTLHHSLRLPTLVQKLQQAVKKRLAKIQTHEQETIACFISSKTIANVMQSHFETKACIQALPIGRPRKRLLLFFENPTTFIDKLLRFVDAQQ